MSSSKVYRYYPIEDQHDPQGTPPNQEWATKPWAYVWVAVALLFGFAVGLGISATILWFGKPTLSPDKESISSSASVTAAATTSHFPRETCGTSVATARAAHCIFDPLTVSWVPPGCSRMMAHEFSAKNFTYYGDKEGQQVLTTPTWAQEWPMPG